MADIWHTWLARSGDWYTALWQHLQLSLSALLTAMAVALPLAVAVQRHKRAAEWVLQAAGVFQTLPSLAVLGLLIPLMGIGTPPAVAALVVYALFPILQNTVTGLNQIDPNLREAAAAFGMTRWERLKKFELALALPVIMSGIRTAAVMIIGTATLAALIGAGGLGSFILLGIDRNDSSLILIGAVSSAALALAFNYLLKKLETIRLRHSVWVLAALIAALAASFAPQRQTESPKATLIVAGKLGSEPEILIQMYKILIETHTDLAVETKPNFGKTGFLYEALKAGKIDIYPEFTGTITASLLNNPPPASTNPDTVYRAARDGILAQDRLALLPPMAYQNTYAVAVTRSFAQQNGLRTIGDLQKIQHRATAGFTLEFNDREDGNLGLQQRYGLRLKVKTLEPALRYQAIRENSIQITDAYSTDSELRQYGLQVLEDNLRLFPPYQGAPLMRQETMEQHPELAAALNRLAGKISAEEMQEMNYRVKAQGQSAESVAREYLQTHGMLE